MRRSLFFCNLKAKYERKKAMKLKKMLAVTALMLTTIVVSNSLISCKPVKVPDGVTVVEPFEVKKYAGQWYEIARFDFKHEKDLNNVTANYSLNEDGSIKVVNRGYNFVKEKWEESVGKAKFLDRANKGALKVSFFGPFYSGYNVVSITPDYQYALIYGENKDYIWILSRTKSIPSNIKEEFLKKAEAYGYDLSRFVWTKHD